MALYVKFDCATCENENCYEHSLPTTEKVCDGYKHTITNADRIRGYTDEELVKFIWNGMETICPNNCHEDPERLCTVCILDWLKQEVPTDGWLHR